MDQNLSIKAGLWLKRFFSGLETGEIGSVQNCLWEISVPPTFNLLPELDLYPEVRPYLELISTFPAKEFTGECLGQVIKWNFETRIRRIQLQTSQFEAFHHEALESIKEPIEYGLAVCKLKLLEESLQQPSDANIKRLLKLMLALEKSEISTLDKLLEASPMAEGENMNNWNNLLGFGSRFAIVHQKDSLLEFFYKFLGLVQKRWSKASLQFPWQACISFIEYMAYKSNDILLPKNGKPFAGEWEHPAEVYDRIFKIFLPEEEHQLWVKYCAKGQREPDWLDRVRRKFYQGSQEAYGHWFHLTGKAVYEGIKAGLEWPEINQMLGHFRALSAFLLANVQVPMEKTLSFSALKKLEHEKNLVSPALFEVPATAQDIILMPVVSKPLGFYKDKIQVLVLDFETTFKDELKKTVDCNPHGRKFEFKKREIAVFSFPNAERLSYTIGCPVQIAGESVMPSQILYNWPKDSVYLSKGNQAVRIEKPHNIIFVPATGGHQQRIDHELIRLYTRLVSRDEIKKAALEHDLTHFFYLYFQRLRFFRGNAANGMILLNILLDIHHIPAPDAPSGYRFIDCEAMCRSEEEFHQGFWAWIQEGSFFP